MDRIDKELPRVRERHAKAKANPPVFPQLIPHEDQKAALNQILQLCFQHLASLQRCEHEEAVLNAQREHALRQIQKLQELDRAVRRLLEVSDEEQQILLRV